MHQNQFIDFFIGSEVSVLLLKGLLEESGIYCIVQNDFRSSTLAGFVGGTTDTLQLKIRKSDVDKTLPILKSFTQKKTKTLPNNT